MMRDASRVGLMPGDMLAADESVVMITTFRTFGGGRGRNSWFTIGSGTLCLITASRVIDHHCYVDEVMFELTLLVGGSLYEYVVDDHNYFLYQFKNVVHPNRT